MGINVYSVPERYSVRLDQIDIDNHNRGAIATSRLYVEQFSPETYREEDVERMGVHPTTWVTPRKQPEKGMILSGAVGTGKSTILGALATELADKRVSVAWVAWPKLVDDLGNPVGSREVMDRLGEVQALFVDELGQASPPEFIKTRLLALLGGRYDSKLPIFATTNLTEPNLESRLGTGLVSRMREACDLESLLGPDRRGAESRVRPRQAKPAPAPESKADEDRIMTGDPVWSAMLSALGDNLAGRMTKAQLADKVTGLAKVAGWPVKP